MCIRDRHVAVDRQVALALRAHQAGLARLLSRSDLPAPSSVVYGRLPLADLYRELYGRDAC